MRESVLPLKDDSVSFGTNCAIKGSIRRNAKIIRPGRHRSLRKVIDWPCLSPNGIKASRNSWTLNLTMILARIFFYVVQKGPSDIMENKCFCSLSPTSLRGNSPFCRVYTCKYTFSATLKRRRGFMASFPLPPQLSSISIWLRAARIPEINTRVTF